jgi:hypothetical protein
MRKSCRETSGLDENRAEILRQIRKCWKRTNASIAMFALLSIIQLSIVDENA